MGDIFDSAADWDPTYWTEEEKRRNNPDKYNPAKTRGTRNQVEDELMEEREEARRLREQVMRLEEEIALRDQQEKAWKGEIDRRKKKAAKKVISPGDQDDWLNINDDDEDAVKWEPVNSTDSTTTYIKHILEQGFVGWTFEVFKVLDKMKRREIHVMTHESQRIGSRRDWNIKVPGAMSEIEVSALVVSKISEDMATMLHMRTLANNEASSS